jgi:hypothetical protein
MSDTTGTVTSFMQLNPQLYEWLTLMPCGLRISFKTGEVVIPESLTLDEASRAFWEGLRLYYPSHEPSAGKE